MRRQTPQSRPGFAGVQPGLLFWPKPSNLRGAVHDFALLYLAVHLFDNCDLEALADAAAERKRWDFLLNSGSDPDSRRHGFAGDPIATF